MSTAVLSYLGGLAGYRSKPAEEKAPIRALPAGWYTSQEMYELERRAIFSRRWQLITHKIRVPNAGDWLKFDVAGFNFIIARDRKGAINAFHNICRHRAYPIVHEEKGTSMIFSCRYHGWSYGLSGNLAKAPGYQELEGFDKSKNGLFRIHTHIDNNGFIWVNFDTKDTPEVAWEDDFAGADTQDKYNDFNFDDYVFDHAWQMDGDYNWKILADNYNECYHCKTTHPDIPAVADLEAYNVETKRGYIIHNVATKPEQRDQGLVVAPTYHFPNVSSNVTPNFFFIQRFIPHSASRSTMSYQVFRNKDATEESFQLVNQMYKRIMSEDKVLCDAAQRNVNAGVFVNGEMHPRMEKGPLFFQNLCREAVIEHWNREKAAKKEIWPARQTFGNYNADAAEKDITFCSGLSCSTLDEKGPLAW
ncbi:hypothetical protein Daus18300_005541 [Diaporthe australafricana]|uniref:Choline monooxygenase, chloroplastic n=1 Tax=Diaporthe australafricana TaxID=127596 RepID=A0ABR3X126_9PEZI